MRPSQPLQAASGLCARAEALKQRPVRLPLRGQRRLGSARGASPSCFPFDCAGVNTDTSTNNRQCKRGRTGAYNRGAMATLDELAERVERLLLRHEELQRTHALTVQQLAVVNAERDSLRSRLAAARQRVDALLDRLPAGELPAAADAASPEGKDDA